MKKILLSILAILILGVANAQLWKSYYDGYRTQFDLTITDSLIFVPAEDRINVYTLEGEYRYSKRIGKSMYTSTLDNNGNVWFGTENGLIMFDGTAWTTYSYDTTYSYSAISIVCDKNDNIWASYNISSSGGFISKFDGTNWEHIHSFKDSIYISGGGKIVVDTNNVVYAGFTTNGNNWTYGVAKINDTDTTIFNYSNSNFRVGHQHFASLDRNNHVWFGGCYNALARYDGTQWFMEGEDTIFHNVSFNDVYLDNQNNKWFGTTEGLFVQDGDNWIKYTDENELYFSPIAGIEEDKNNNVWFVSNTGYEDNPLKTCLTKFIDNEFTHYFPNTFRGSPKKVVIRNDEVWLQTNKICVLKDGLWKINDIDGITHYSRIRDITKDDNDNIWIVIDTTLYKIDIDNNVYSITNILGNNLGQHSTLASLGNIIWIKSSNHLYKFENNTWSEIPIDMQSTNYFYNITPINNNDLWVSTTISPMKFENGTWTSYTTTDGLASDMVYDIALEDDKVWFATASGISLLEGDNWTTFTHDSVHFSFYNRNYTVHIDENGDKWFGVSKGIYKYNDESFEFIQPSGIEDMIKYITEDDDGNIWVAGEQALSQYSFNSYEVEDSIYPCKELRLYPNPATNSFNINLSKLESPDQLNIYTITGDCILSKKVVAGRNNIKLDNIASGIYIVKLNKKKKMSKLMVE